MSGPIVASTRAYRLMAELLPGVVEFVCDDYYNQDGKPELTPLPPACSTVHQRLEVGALDGLT